MLLTAPLAERHDVAEATVPLPPGSGATRGRAEDHSMRRTATALIGATLMLGVLVVPAVSAQEVPLCGPPGGEVPATIVGSGTIVGTQGDDVIVGSSGADRILGLGGDDIICGEGGNDVAIGGAGDDILIGDGVDLPPFLPSDGTNDDLLIGGPGNDTLAGLGGDDTLIGGDGNDQLIGMGGVDRIRGGPGDDTAFGGPSDDDIAGGPGNDTLWGTFGSDLISGGPGNDLIDGDNPFPTPPFVPPFIIGTNDDTCVGGPGADTVTNCETAS